MYDLLNYFKEVINLTKDLLKEELNEKIAKNKPQGHQWKPGDKCMAIWRVDGK